MHQLACIFRKRFCTSLRIARNLHLRRNYSIMQPIQYRPFGTLRFLLAVAVVISHSWILTFQNPQAHFVQQIGIGNVAVMGFFILSGFIITEALSSFYRGHPWRFLANRFARLAPPYWAALLLSIALHAAVVSLGDLRLLDYAATPPGMFATDNLFANWIAIFPRPGRLMFAPESGFYGFVRFYWAIYIEFCFYGVAFIIMLTSSIIEKQRRFAITSASIALVLLLHIVHEYVRPLHWELAYVPYFALGACVFFCISTPRLSAVLGACVAYALVFLHFARYTQGQIPAAANWVPGLANLHVLTPLLSLLVFPALICWLSMFRQAGVRH